MQWVCRQPETIVLTYAYINGVLTPRPAYLGPCTNTTPAGDCVRVAEEQCCRPHPLTHIDTSQLMGRSEEALLPTLSNWVGRWDPCLLPLLFPKTEEILLLCLAGRRPCSTALVLWERRDASLPIPFRRSRICSGGNAYPAVKAHRHVYQTLSGPNKDTLLLKRKPLTLPRQL